MNPPLEHIRLNRKARDQLIRLRRSTGIEQWNILCRWAFCFSIRDARIPPAVEGDGAASVEIAWRVFTGDHPDVFTALFRTWKVAFGDSPLDDGEILRRHVQRGLSMLDSQGVESVDDLVLLVSEPVSH